MGQNCFVEVQYSNWFLSLIARLRVVLVPEFKTLQPPSELFCRSTRITPLSGLRAILSALSSKIVFPWEPTEVVFFGVLKFLSSMRSVVSGTLQIETVFHALCYNIEQYDTSLHVVYK